MHRSHDLAVAPLARRAPGQRCAEAGALPGQLRLAGLLEKDADAGGMRDRRAAERDAMIAHEHREARAERLRQRNPLIPGGDQGDVGLVARHLDEIVGIEREGLQRIERGRDHAGVKRMRVRDDLHVRPQR